MNVRKILARRVKVIIWFRDRKNLVVRVISMHFVHGWSYLRKILNRKKRNECIFSNNQLSKGPEL